MTETERQLRAMTGEVERRKVAEGLSKLAAMDLINQSNEAAYLALESLIGGAAVREGRVPITDAQWFRAHAGILKAAAHLARKHLILTEDTLAQMSDEANQEEAQDIILISLDVLLGASELAEFMTEAASMIDDCEGPGN